VKSGRSGIVFVSILFGQELPQIAIVELVAEAGVYGEHLPERINPNE
jgi:hypothetical protein